MKEITPCELQKILDNPDYIIIDVREVYEFDEMRLENAVNMPVSSITCNLTSIPKDKNVIIMCKSGGRSSAIYRILEGQGYTNIINLKGGILLWKEMGYSVI